LAKGGTPPASGPSALSILDQSEAAPVDPVEDGVGSGLGRHRKTQTAKESAKLREITTGNRLQQQVTGYNSR